MLYMESIFQIENVTWGNLYIRYLALPPFLPIWGIHCTMGCQPLSRWIYVRDCRRLMGRKRYVLHRIVDFTYFQCWSNYGCNWGFSVNIALIWYKSIILPWLLNCCMLYFLQLSAFQIKAEMEKTLQWLATVATNTTKYVKLEFYEYS